MFKKSKKKKKKKKERKKENLATMYKIYLYAVIARNKLLE